MQMWTWTGVVEELYVIKGVLDVHLHLMQNIKPS